MSLFDSADLLSRTKVVLNRPSTDEALSDPQLYALLSEAQYEAVLYLAARVPDALMVEPTELTTADDAVFTFGDDADSADIVALGHYRIYPSLASIPDSPFSEGEDFTIEGDRIRLTNGRTYSGPLFGQWVNPPGVIDASTQPTLVKPARLALPYGAAARAAVRLRMDPAEYRNEFTSQLNTVLTTLRTRSSGGGHGLRGGYR
jgi:hypothetical protein